MGARYCSYCLNAKHNRRTCETLAQDTYRVRIATNKYRENLMDRLVSGGFGVGALVSVRGYADAGLVKSISLEDMTPVSRGSAGTIEVLNVGGRRNGKTDKLSFAYLPEQFNDILNRDTEDHRTAREAGKFFRSPRTLMKILSPVKKSGNFENMVLASVGSIKDALKRAQWSSLRPWTERPRSRPVDRNVYHMLNIVPESYREHDKHRRRVQMEKINAFLENGKISIDIY